MTSLTTVVIYSAFVVMEDPCKTLLFIEDHLLQFNLFSFHLGLIHTYVILSVFGVLSHRIAVAALIKLSTFQEDTHIRGELHGLCRLRNSFR